MVYTRQNNYLIWHSAITVVVRPVVLVVNSNVAGCSMITRDVGRSRTNFVYVYVDVAYASNIGSAGTLLLD